ncbi:hypothetical protein AAEX28_12580 [Lentisphaerota bacterium WC36G]|nr:hypothetical protein LJT99_15405 [Lentisphaerae bacterium WC36]
MKKLLTLILISIAFLTITGCSISKGLAEKSNVYNGYGGVSKITTAFDPTTGTPAPQVLNVVGEVTAATIHNGENSKDVIAFFQRLDSSIFNSDAKTNKTTLIIGTTNQEIIKTAIDAINKKLSSQPTQTANNKVQNE